MTFVVRMGPGQLTRRMKANLRANGRRKTHGHLRGWRNHCTGRSPDRRLIPAAFDALAEMILPLAWLTGRTRKV